MCSSLARPCYRKSKTSLSYDSSVGEINHITIVERKLNAISSAEAHAALVPWSAHSRSMKKRLGESRSIWPVEAF